MGKVELLSPAGNFDALKGAISAGADAVYLGGERYGARAYADNFTADEICEGIHYAHVFGRKIYLTVNTLVKEKELDGLYHFVLPFYEKGLDGVIVQDFGVLRFLRHYFPELSLHASTQMTITGPLGAALVKKEGISRIVPARELSLDELICLKQKTGVEIEAFIHGAMCYCYSGQCLFSSLLGGRSGNRGRCAQPCRLPYQVQGENGRQPALKASPGQSNGGRYPLSMKDMCTIDLLPELIEAGIDSFKIEGRMKNPAYAAGVTAVYRKYIDLYYQDKKHYQVSGRDRELLGSLYIRSETGDGYYHRRNGREMISLSSPAYSPTQEALLTSIRQKYTDRPLSHRAEAKIVLKAGENARLSLEMTLNMQRLQVCVTGQQVQAALKQPLSREKIEEQLRKSGNSLIGIEQVTIEGAENIFMPIRSLNELRRSAAAALEKEILHAQILEGQISDQGSRTALPDSFSPSAGKAMTPAANIAPAVSSAGAGRVSIQKNLHASVTTSAQLKAAFSEGIGRIYVDYGLLDELGEVFPKGTEPHAELYGVTPYIVREKDEKYLEKLLELLLSGVLKGVLVRNPESASFFADNISKNKIVLDANLYIWNREALHFWEARAGAFYLPTECNARELRELLDACPDRRLRAGAVIYGRLPMMVTANCVRKTMGKCGKKRGITLMEDRYGKRFPVYSDCLCCYNVIYNSVPLSLHRQFAGQIPSDGDYRLDFTLEQEEETRQIIRYFQRLAACSDQKGAGDVKIPDPVYREYTTGHYKRGVE